MKTKKYIIDDEYLVSQWDYKKNNGVFDPATLTIGSKKKPWWICTLGHSYQQQIYAKKSQKQGCPYCAGKKILPGFNDIATLYPQLLKEWCPENTIKPSEISGGSKQEILWKCSVCNNTWTAPLSNRTKNNSGCPYCTNQKPIKGINDLATVFPDIALEWDDLNNDQSPSDFLPYSQKSVFWNCPVCGHVYKMKIQNRTNQHQSCPKCAKRFQTSFPEQAIYYYLKKNFPDCVNNEKDVLQSKHELDIYIPSKKTAIEYDGQRWHRSYDNDKKKYECCKKAGIYLIRVREDSLPFLDGISDITIISHYNQGKKISFLVDVLQELFSFFQINIDPRSVFQDEAEIINSYYSKLKHHSVDIQFPELISEWLQEKNGNVTLSMVSPSDKHKFWWRCNQCGHEWEASIGKRTQGRGCPICGRTNAAKNTTIAFIKKNGSFAEKNPEIASEWDYEKNAPLTPNEVTNSCNKKVWWNCPKGHSYLAFVSDRTSKGSGCPYCAGKIPVKGENDLATTNPELILDWDYSKNGLPENYKAGSNKKVWWKCHICGFEWSACIYSRAQNGRGCRMCAQKKRNAKNNKGTDTSV